MITHVNKSTEDQKFAKDRVEPRGVKEINMWAFKKRDEVLLNDQRGFVQDLV